MYGPLITPPTPGSTENKSQLVVSVSELPPIESASPWFDVGAAFIVAAIAAWAGAKYGGKGASEAAAKIAGRRERRRNAERLNEIIAPAGAMTSLLFEYMRAMHVEMVERFLKFAEGRQVWVDYLKETRDNSPPTLVDVSNPILPNPILGFIEPLDRLQPDQFKAIGQIGNQGKHASAVATHLQTHYRGAAELSVMYNRALDSVRATRQKAEDLRLPTAATSVAVQGVSVNFLRTQYHADFYAIDPPGICGDRTHGEILESIVRHCAEGMYLANLMAGHIEQCCHAARARWSEDEGPCPVHEHEVDIDKEYVADLPELAALEKQWGHLRASSQNVLDAAE